MGKDGEEMDELKDVLPITEKQLLVPKMKEREEWISDKT